MTANFVPCKKMVYYSGRIHPPEVLCLGKYLNYDFLILNMGSHPTAYVKVPKDHPFFGKFYDECNPPHGFLGGPFTFSDSSANFANLLDQPIPDGWYLGWDYAHVGDYTGYWSEEENMRMGNRKYTTEEIILDCEEVVKYLKEKYEPRKRQKKNTTL